MTRFIQATFAGLELENTVARFRQLSWRRVVAEGGLLLALLATSSWLTHR